MSVFKYFLPVLFALGVPVAGFGKQGITDDAVAFAQIAAMEGPAGALGQGMRLGIMAAFEEANAAGGVHGRQLHLESFDDGYVPERAVRNLEKVIGGNAHLGLVGGVGTGTAQAMLPLIKGFKVPTIGTLSGAGFLRDPDNGPIMNIRASYSAETEAWIKYLVDEKGYERIALLYQDDGFGRVGLAGVTAALDRRSMSLVADGTYTRNSRAVKEALLEIRAAKPDAVVMVGAYRPITEFIQVSRRLEFSPVFVNISFVGSQALSDALGKDGENVIISQVVPFPWDDSVPVVAQYQTALTDVAPEAAPDFVSFEGYLAGRLTVAALEASGPDLTRKNFRNAMAALRDIDLGGLAFTYGAGDNQGLEQVFLTRITGAGAFELIQ